MVLPEEAPDVILKVFARLLSATLQAPGVARSHIHALEVAGEDLLEILPTIDHVSRQVVQPDPSRVS
jgi:hypothetical protein